ncbi:MAG: hypothetical protein R3F62_23365 [Planctomycetota bacterium]
MIDTFKQLTFVACGLVLVGAALALAPGERARAVRRWVVDLLGEDAPCPICSGRAAPALPDPGDPHPRGAR